MASLCAPQAFARTTMPNERQLRFYHLHTGEQLHVTYWAEGDYIRDELASINKLLRDHRSGEVEAIDPHLLDQLFLLQHHVTHTGAYHIISGYRSPRTNKALRKDGSGVAKRSLHMQGRAIDVRLPGVELQHLRLAALGLRAGGVGYYPDSNFIHLDTGRPRFW